VPVWKPIFTPAELVQQNNWFKNKIACTGYCMAAGILLANTILPFKAAVSYMEYELRLTCNPRASCTRLCYSLGGLDNTFHKRMMRDQRIEKENKPYASIVFSYADHGFSAMRRPSTRSS